ncbi:molybdopterin-dependent oxidoreductase [Cumulibacter manganitolerans]|uniref:molybdopterin-dependent oxidoreductase n=1 Tax=Cumulibacter manganitolerans TaxID=1884992 RepID=UPI001E46108F|nr:molybdopterin-dependent oxidoreductase [Cumulibacter manganitolerans]
MGTMHVWSRALAGVAAGVAGLGVGQLAAAAIEPESAPVLAVGASVVDLTPQPVKQWAIDTFGSSDKVFLLTVVGVVALVAFVVAGLVSRRTSRWGEVVLGALAVVCAVAAMTRPVATVLSLVPSAITGVVAVVVLRKLIPLLAAVSPRSSSERSSEAERRGDATDAAPATRRRFLQLGGAALAVGAVTLAAGQWIIATARTAARVVLPKAAQPLPPLPEGVPIDGISPFRTPSADFYRVDTALTIPSIDPGSWRLEIGGDVEHPKTLSFEDLQKYEIIERDITMTCVSNPVGGEYIGSARWLGVRVSDVLKDVGIKDGVDQIFSEDVDGMTISTPVQALTDDREAMLAFGMNGEQLPREHGFPVRLVTPGLYGFVGSTKWVTKLTATTYAAKRAYWTERDWVTDAPVLTQSRIDTPQPLSAVNAGRETHIGGVAWAQGRGISKVEVRIDDGPWQQATMGPDAGIDYWRQWYLPWTPPKGTHTLTVRATDATGQVQTTDRAEPFPSGATGQQSIVVTAP